MQSRYAGGQEITSSTEAEPYAGAEPETGTQARVGIPPDIGAAAEVAAEPDIGAERPLGPVPIENDSWDAVFTDIGALDNGERYHGRRRAGEPRWRARRVAVAAALVTLVAGAGLAWMRPPGSAGFVPSLPFLQPGAQPSIIDSQSAGPEVSHATVRPAAAPGTRSSTGQGGVVGQDGTQVTGQVASATATPGGSSVGQAPAFVAVTIEAEAGSPQVILTGAARVVSYSGASGDALVTGIGNPGDGQQPGALEIVGLEIPTAGTYAFAISFTIDGTPGPRAATISVSGVAPFTVSFAGGPSCCIVRSVEVTLAAGSHTFTISNDAGMGPSIDKVVITQP